ncbi:phage capsid protein [Variovorax sp. J22G73]|uniref:phage capsid protein n=1 Tax=unclassified Variovorax TaxID=663243 RepID=UPI00257816E0|nr:MULTISPECIES: phage capsid protein [unclassified Variovorax]MDM0006453.1 phage capsid protein [Variovorax sp. J22R203]MDM0097524.1 phage capsid protein [Variovorax sp. J22G73]
MSFGDNGNPIAFGTGASGTDDRALFLKQFGGEVLTALTANTLTAGKTREKSIGAGKSWQFPRTGVSVAEYITRGQELLGNGFLTDEVTITVDAPLTASHALWDLDVLMSHFDVRSPITTEMGAVLGRTIDQNVFRSVALAARTAASSAIPGSGGTLIVDAGLTNVDGTSGKAWMDAIRKAKRALYAKNIPVGATIYMVVNYTVFDAIKYATDGNGNFINLNSMINLAAAGLGSAVTEAIRFEGVTIMPSNLLPTANETAVTSVYSKYRADYSKTTGLMWLQDATATLSLVDVTVETDRDVRRQEDFMVAKVVKGHGTLRSEYAVEFKTA